MARKPVFGTCRICRDCTRLSFDHVPPAAAFNNCRTVYKEVFKLIGEDPDRYLEPKWTMSQNGVGAHSLCEPCNNDTGKWYGDAFAVWARQGMEMLENAQGAPSLYYTFHIFPLRVIKQIVCMFFSINDTQFSYNHPDLVKFVLYKNERYLNPDLRIYAFFNGGVRSRYIAGAGILKMNPDEIDCSTLEDMTSIANATFEKSRGLCEIACRPIGYVMSFDPAPPDNRLVDISFFARYSYSDWTSISLRLPALPVWTYFPGDYRNRGQVERDTDD